MCICVCVCVIGREKDTVVRVRERNEKEKLSNWDSETGNMCVCVCVYLCICYGGRMCMHFTNHNIWKGNTKSCMRGRSCFDKKLPIQKFVLKNIFFRGKVICLCHHSLKKSYFQSRRICSRLVNGKKTIYKIFEFYTLEYETFNQRT